MFGWDRLETFSFIATQCKDKLQNLNKFYKEVNTDSLSLICKAVQDCRHSEKK